ncbi:MAG: DUF1206 domain-containing protein [Cyanobacteria bacterium P01_A01_bin.84]
MSVNLEEHSKEAVSHPWFEKLARFGFAARGLIYIVIGILATQTAFSSGGKTTGSSGALVEIVRQPFGKILLGILTVGIIGFVLWRLVQGILDPEHSEIDAKRILKRIGYISSAIAYGGLALTAIQLIMGSGGGRNKDSTQDWTARVMSQPFGIWLVGIGGAIAIIIGGTYIYKAWKEKFRKKWKLDQMSRKERKWATYIGKFGLIARGTVFVIIGIFLIQASLQSDPSEARGLGGTLSTLAQQPFGSWILGIVAFGLVAYGIHCMFEARYRRIIVN